MRTISFRGFTRVSTIFAIAALMNVRCTFAQSDTGADFGTNFQGAVRYESNSPAQFVQVELWTDGESSWRTITTTDRMGKFHAGAPCMVIQYKIEQPGYIPVYGRVDMSIKPCRVLEDGRATRPTILDRWSSPPFC